MRAPRAGLTLTETMIAFVVLIVAVGTTMGVITSFTVMEQANRERALACHAARRTLEEMHARNFSDVFALYNETTADDPGGTVPGPGFDVFGLDPQEGDADGRVGRVLFPTPAGSPGVLQENIQDEAFGMPRDLDADGDEDGLDKSGTYKLLPVIVRVEWRGQSGNRRLEFQTLLRPQ